MPKKKKPLIPLLPQVMDYHLDDDDRLEGKIQKDIMDHLKKIPFSTSNPAEVPWLNIPPATSAPS